MAQIEKENKFKFDSERYSFALLDFGMPEFRESASEDLKRLKKFFRLEKKVIIPEDKKGLLNFIQEQADWLDDEEIHRPIASGGIS